MRKDQRSAILPWGTAGVKRGWQGPEQAWYTAAAVA